MKKQISIILVAAMLISLFCSAQAVLASANAELVSPANGAYVNCESAIPVKGTLEAGYDAGSAKIYIDGVCKKTLADNITALDDVIESDGISDLNFGKHNITLEAAYGGEKVASTKEFILTGFYDKPISDDITTSTKQSGKFTGGLSYDFNVGTSKLYDYSNNSGSISFTRNATATSTSGNKADAYFRFGTLTADDYVLDHGRFIFKAKLTMNTSAYSMLLSVKGSNGGKSVTWYNNKDILSGGKFFGEMSCTSGATYDIELIYDFDNNTETCIVNDSTLVEKTVAEMDKLNSFSLKWSGANAAEGDKITWDEIQLIHIARLPLIDTLEYNLNNETNIEQAAWSDGQLDPEAQSVTVVMEKRLDEMPDVTLQKAGAEVPLSAALSSDNTKLVITPDDGFEAGFTYTITLSAVACEGITYPRSIAEAYKTQSNADVSFWVNSDGLYSSNQIGKDDVISARIGNVTLPGGITDATYVLSIRKDMELVAMTGKTLSNTDNWQGGFELKLAPIAEAGEYEVYLMVIDNYRDCKAISRYMSIK